MQLGEMLSIIMPVFNAEDTLKESIDSVVVNNTNGHELIIVDDASTDNSLEIIKDYEKKYDFIKVYSNKKNLGGGATRNHGVMMSKSQYIFVLDSDDILCDGTLERALNEIIEFDADAVAQGKAVFFKKSIIEVEKEISFKKGQIYFSDLISNEPNSVIGNLIFKRNIFDKVGGYPENHGFDTQGFGFRLLAYNAKIFVSDYQFYFQRLPTKPSYYIREYRNGNINKNWFFILFESLYKFESKARNLIMQYDYSCPYTQAKGNNVFHDLVLLSESGQNIFNYEGVDFDPDEAIKNYKESSNDLGIWAKFYMLYRDDYKIYECKNTKMKNLFPAFYLLLANSELTNFNYYYKLRYFLETKKTFSWRLKFFYHKILNKLRIL